MIVVTGGAGFIGSNLIAGLEEAGYSDIVVCDMMGDGDKWKNIAKREVRDIVTPQELYGYLHMHATEVDVVFQMDSVVNTTSQNAGEVLDKHFKFARQLWKWCAMNDARFIYGSSYATYGDGKSGFDDSEDPEDLAALRPMNPHGWSQHLFNRRIVRLANTPKTERTEPIPPQWAGLKFFNVYGPNEYHDDDQMSVVTRSAQQIKAGAAAKLFRSYNEKYKDGEQVRDFIYIKDCVDVMLWLLKNPDVNGLFNLGTGTGRTFNDMAQALGAAFGSSPKITYVDMPQDLQVKYQYFTQAEMAKLQKAGYNKPFTSLEDGIKDYVDTYLKVEDRYR